MIVGLVVSGIVVFSFVIMIILHYRKEKREDSSEEIKTIMNRIIDNYNKQI